MRREAQGWQIASGGGGGGSRTALQGQRCDLAFSRALHGTHPNRHRLARPLHRRSIRLSLDDAGLLHMATSAGGGAALPAAASLGSLARSASVSNPFDVTELLARISLLPATPAPPPALASTGGSGGPRCLSTDGVNRMQWVQPSGEAGLLNVTPGLFMGRQLRAAHGMQQRVDF